MISKKNFNFSLISQNSFPLYIGPFWMWFGPEKTAEFLDHVASSLHDKALTCICRLLGWIVLTENDFWECSWSQAEISMTETCLFLMQFHLRAQRSGVELFIVPRTQEYLQIIWIFWWYWVTFSSSCLLFPAFSESVAAIKFQRVHLFICFPCSIVNKISHLQYSWICKSLHLLTFYSVPTFSGIRVARIIYF